MASVRRVPAPAHAGFSGIGRTGLPRVPRPGLRPSRSTRGFIPPPADAGFLRNEWFTALRGTPLRNTPRGSMTLTRSYIPPPALRAQDVGDATQPRAVDPRLERLSMKRIGYPGFAQRTPVRAGSISGHDGLKAVRRAPATHVRRLRHGSTLRPWQSGRAGRGRRPDQSRQAERIEPAQRAAEYSPGWSGATEGRGA